eukprot:22441-Pelagococcus_subviridis.AAC.1
MTTGGASASPPPAAAIAAPSFPSAEVVTFESTVTRSNGMSTEGRSIRSDVGVEFIGVRWS